LIKFATVCPLTVWNSIRFRIAVSRKSELQNACTELSTGKVKVVVVRVLSYRSGGPGSIPDTTRKKKLWVWNGVHSAS
jgi:hypothetical protein